MNVYDFDDTILEGDTERYFLPWIFKNYPQAKPYQSEYNFYLAIQNMGLITRDDSRPHMYAFLREFDPEKTILVRFLIHFDLFGVFAFVKG